MELPLELGQGFDGFVRGCRQAIQKKHPPLELAQRFGAFVRECRQAIQREERPLELGQGFDCELPSCIQVVCKVGEKLPVGISSSISKSGLIAGIIGCGLSVLSSSGRAVRQTEVFGAQRGCLAILGMAVGHDEVPAPKMHRGVPV